MVVSAGTGEVADPTPFPGIWPVDWDALSGDALSGDPTRNPDAHCVPCVTPSYAVAVTPHPDSSVVQTGAGFHLQEGFSRFLRLNRPMHSAEIPSWRTRPGCCPGLSGMPGGSGHRALTAGE